MQTQAEIMNEYVNGTVAIETANPPVSDPELEALICALEAKWTAERKA